MSVSSIIDPTTGKIYDDLIGQGGGINLAKGQIITATAIQEVAFPIAPPADGSVLSYDSGYAINELIGMGPAQGNIVAKGLLQSGRLSEYLGLRGSLYGTGASVAGVGNTAGQKTYTININKANVSAAEIIKEIRNFEKQTNKKYFAN